MKTPALPQSTSCVCPNDRSRVLDENANGVLCTTGIVRVEPLGARASCPQPGCAGFQPALPLRGTFGARGFITAFSAGDLSPALAVPPHSLQFVIRNSQFVIARALAAILFIFAFLALGATTATTFAAATPGAPVLGGVCGFSWEHVPTSPFMGKNEIMDLGDYRFQYVEELAKAEVNGQGKDKPKIQLNLLFSPVPEAYLGGQLLGRGWWFPAFESTLLQTDARTYVLGLPNGDRVTLHKNGNSLGGGSWLGTVSTRETVLKTSCGWVAKFQQGRLVELNSPSRERYQFAISRDGVRTITYNGRVVLTLTRKIDEQTTFPVYTLSYVAEGKSQKAHLRMGLRPVLIKINEKENGRDVTKEREEDTNSLSSVKVSDEPEKKYNFGMDSLTVGSFHRWDRKTYDLIQKDQETYSTVVIRGIKCFKTTYPDGSSRFHGSGSNEKIHKTRDGVLTRTEYMPRLAAKEQTGSVPWLPKLRQVSEIDGAGNEIPKKRFWYDEDGKLIRSWVASEGGGIFRERKGDVTILRDAKRGLISEKTLDKSGKLIALRTSKTKYTFEYPDKSNKVIIKQHSDTSVVEKIVTYEEFNSITGRFWVIVNRQE